MFRLLLIECTVILLIVGTKSSSVDQIFLGFKSYCGCGYECSTLRGQRPQSLELELLAIVSWVCTGLCLQPPEFLVF